jgi:hypothetical protein
MYTNVDFVQELKVELMDALRELDVKGRIYICETGINAQFISPVQNMLACEAVLRSVGKQVFANMYFFTGDCIDHTEKPTKDVLINNKKTNSKRQLVDDASINNDIPTSTAVSRTLIPVALQDQLPFVKLQVKIRPLLNDGLSQQQK